MYDGKPLKEATATNIRIEWIKVRRMENARARAFGYRNNRERFPEDYATEGDE